ncbi:unnamed protein product [Symbiodinium pilosum]|uniref:Uncharacterized protein n=1 Tax=Symbiodinium pilosum TaxID=2952 RepID=A0A812QVA7_SYMPI|nr:unnamed protein product [Symbiodinium pilosum]
MPSQRMLQSKQKITQALQTLSDQVEVVAERAKITLWAVTLLGKLIYVAQAEGDEFVMLRASFANPSEFTTAQALVFANAWNRKMPFFRASVVDDSKLCLEFHLMINWIPQTGGLEKVIGMFTAALLMFAKEMHKATRQSDDSQLRSLL